MSYMPPFQYKLKPTHAYKVLRNCSGCGKKSIYHSTGCFRVNANGSKLDIWLIYQCESCKHTYNLSIYERVFPNEVPTKEYEAFLSNDESLALSYGTNPSLFSKNKAVIDWKQNCYTLSYQGVHTLDSTLSSYPFKKGDQIKIELPVGFKIRPDKLLCSLLQVSRSQLKKQLDEGRIHYEVHAYEHTVLVSIQQELSLETTKLQTVLAV